MSPAISPALAGRPAAPPFTSLQDTVAWMNDYRQSRDVARVPDAVQAMSRFGAFRDPDTAGVQVGFIAGVIGANPDRASRLVAGMIDVAPEDQWAIVRGIAYSGAPQWRHLLRQYAGRMPERRAMIDAYLSGRLATLDELRIMPSPTTWQRIRAAFAVGGNKTRPALEPTQNLLDTLWGYYLASGEYAPLLQIVDLLPWADDGDNVERLTLGSMAKYTLAMNAARDMRLLAMLKTLRRVREKNPDTVKVLDEVIVAAEYADTGKLRRDALASIEQLRMKGPAYKREMSAWAKVGQGALAVGCVAAAATGHVELGLPCVIGGGATNAAAYYLNDR